MSLKYLLDTNVVSEPLRPVTNQKILDRLQQHQNEIAIASVVWHELLFGCYRLPPSAKRTLTSNCKSSSRMKRGLASKER